MARVSETSATETQPWSLRQARFGALVVAIGTLILMATTAPGLSIVWDEGFTLGREARLSEWFRALADPPAFAASWKPPRPGEELVQSEGSPRLNPVDLDSSSKLWNDPALAYFWPFAREEPHGHPPFYALLGVAGARLSPSSWEPLARARLGPMVLFSLVAGGLFGFFARRRGFWPALLASGAWALQPRLFAHGHYALYDAPLAALWVLSILAFAEAVRVEAGARHVSDGPRWAWVVVFGILVGAAAATKLTGWFLPIPFVIWTAIRRDRLGIKTLLVGGFIALVTLYALVPPWWRAPISGVSRFLQSNLSRAETIRIQSLFLGQIYETPRDSLPWYNTLVWMVFVAPPGFLILALIGSVQATRRLKTDPFGSLAVGHWILLLILRSLPHTPGHDADRQLIPAFGCLAIVAGLGSEWILDRLIRLGKAIVAISISESVLGIVLMMPIPLSYYSPIVGGLPGATALGMEPTYYWDSMTPEAVAWLNDHTQAGDKVAFATNPTTWLYLHQVGVLKPDYRPWAPGKYRWYVVQNRPGAMRDIDRELIARLGPAHVLVSRMGVPLVWAFPYSELEQAAGARP